MLARDPEMRLRDLADALEISERCAFTIVSDLVHAGYIVKERDGRRNRYRIETDAVLREVISDGLSIGELLDLLVGARSAEGCASQVALRHASASHGHAPFSGPESRFDGPSWDPRPGRGEPSRPCAEASSRQSRADDGSELPRPLVEHDLCGPHLDEVYRNDWV